MPSISLGMTKKISLNGRGQSLDLFVKCAPHHFFESGEVRYFKYDTQIDRGEY